MVDLRIEEIAENTLKDINSKNEFDFLNNPIPIITIVERMGFKVIASDIKEDGQIILNNKLKETFDTNKVIVVNKEQSNSRRRFTVAHELGHYLMHVDENIRRSDSPFFAYRDTHSETTRLEREANAFAAAILMPRDSIINIVSKYRPFYYDDMLIEIVSKTFLVSMESARYRLQNLGYIVG